MTASYSELQSGGSAMPSAAEVAAELHRFMLNDTEPKSRDRILSTISQLAYAPCSTAADALALVVFSDMLMAAAQLQLPQAPDEEISQTYNPRYLLGVARHMHGNAMTALEGISGLARESFDLDQRTTN